MFQNICMALILVTCAGAATADTRWYTEYKHDMNFIDEEYVQDSARNNLRFGAQGEIFYIEAGPSERAGDFGASLEAGYKWKFADSWELKGKLESFQFDQNEGDVGSKIETELRYYFN